MLSEFKFAVLAVIAVLAKCHMLISCAMSAGASPFTQIWRTLSF